NSTDITKLNADDSAPATPVSGSIAGQTPGSINAVQLASETHTAGVDSVGNQFVQVAYKFDETICAGPSATCVAAPTAPDPTKFKAYDADGTALVCAAAL